MEREGKEGNAKTKKKLGQGTIEMGGKRGRNLPSPIPFQFRRRVWQEDHALHTPSQRSWDLCYPRLSTSYCLRLLSMLAWRKNCETRIKSTEKNKTKCWVAKKIKHALEMYKTHTHKHSLTYTHTWNLSNANFEFELFLFFEEEESQQRGMNTNRVGTTLSDDVEMPPRAFNASAWLRRSCAVAVAVAVMPLLLLCCDDFQRRISAPTADSVSLHCCSCWCVAMTPAEAPFTARERLSSCTTILD